MENKDFKMDQVAIRIIKEPPLQADYPIRSPQDVIRLMSDLLIDYDREVVAIINLRADLKPINVNIASIGALDHALAKPRELLKTTILSNAAGMLMVHNHPSGELLPSTYDIEATETIANLCGMLGVKFYEHVIVGQEDQYYSFYENNMVPLPKKLVQGRMELREITDKLEQGGQRSFPVTDIRKC